MKRIISICFFSLLTISQIFSQDYTPFDITDTKWVMSKLVPSAGNNAKVYYHEVYTKEDTTINDIRYTLLATKNLCKLINSPSEVVSDDNIIKEELVFGAIREDSKKVYFYRFDDGVTSGYFSPAVYLEPMVDHLLYDFNAEVGDTIHHSSQAFTVILEKYLDSDGVRVFEYLNSTDESFANICDAVIKEGKGSGDGLFAAFDSYYTDLECYKSGGPLDGISCSNCKNYVTATDDIYITKTDVLYPNPAHNLLFVQDNYVDQIKSIAIYNIQGQKINELVFRKSDNRIDLDILNLPPGMVIFELVFDNGQRKLEKVVVQR